MSEAILIKKKLEMLDKDMLEDIILEACKTDRTTWKTMKIIIKKKENK